MKEPLKKIESGENIVWLTQPKEIEKLLRRKSTALNIAKGKINDSGGKIETAIQTAEAFGRGLFAELIRKNTNEWTMETWLKPVSDKIFNPMGTAAAFTEITKNKAKSFVFRYPINDEELKEPYLSSLFTYGFLRGVFLSAFPNGAIILNRSMAEGAQMDEFIFKTDIENEEINESKMTKD